MFKRPTQGRVEVARLGGKCLQLFFHDYLTQKKESKASRTFNSPDAIEVRSATH